MAGIAGKAVGVIRRNNLRKRFRLGRVGLMTADTEYGRVEFGGRHGTRIIRMFRQRAVAGLTIHMRMPAIFLFVEHIDVTGLAGLMAGEVDGPGRDFGECVAAIMAVLPKALRHHKTPNDQEEEDASEENPRQPEKMARISENIHVVLSIPMAAQSSLLFAAVCRVKNGHTYLSESGRNPLCSTSRSISTDITLACEVVGNGLRGGDHALTLGNEMKRW